MSFQGRYFEHLHDRNHAFKHVRKSFRKIAISYLLIRTCTCAPQGVKTNHFLDDPKSQDSSRLKLLISRKFTLKIH